MAFARKVWKLLVAIKDGLVLLFMLLFFGLLYAALSFRPTPAAVHEGALLLSLDGVVVEEPQQIDPLAIFEPVPATREHRARDVIRAIEGAASDGRIKAVVLDLDYFLGAGQVTLSDIGAAMDKVRRADKPVLVHAIAYTADSAQLAGHASEVWLDPMGAAMLAGPGGSYLFWGDLAERWGINVHVYRAGQFKSAVEPYSRGSFSQDARRDIEPSLEALWDNWLAELRRGRPKAKVEALIADPAAAARAAGGNPAQAALASGLVDMLGTREAFAAHIAELVGEAKHSRDDGIEFAHTTYQDWLKAEPLSKKGKAIGLVTVAGTIIDGDAGPGTAGGDRIADLLDDALDDDLVALVVRIDSPGGSATASERIRQAILRHKANGIPVVVSMANVAASGGYWVATSGDAIFAEPSTITGSIGVFSVLPTFENALPRLGIKTDSLKTTALSGQPDLLGGFSAELDAALQVQVEHSYDMFLDLVEDSRKIDRAKALTLAEGRTWHGGAARQVGLVDRFGGLHAALEYAAKQADLGAGEWHVLPIDSEPDTFTAFVQSLTEGDDEAQARADFMQVLVAQRNAALMAGLEDLETMLAAPGVQARCTACPVPERLLQAEADLPRWLRAAARLLSGD